MIELAATITPASVLTRREHLMGHPFSCSFILSVSLCRKAGEWQVDVLRRSRAANHRGCRFRRDEFVAVRRCRGRSFTTRAMRVRKLPVFVNQLRWIGSKKFLDLTQGDLGSSIVLIRFNEYDVGVADRVAGGAPRIVVFDAVENA
jgi:hypothetical protein